MIKINPLVSLLIGTLFFMPVLSHAQVQKTSKPEKKAMHQEVKGDNYIPNVNPKTSPAYHFRNSQIFTTQVNVNANGQNILGDAANEPSLAIDPTNPNRMIMGWRQFDNVSSNFRQAGWAYSNNGGASWTFPGVINQGIFRSDPVLDSDTAGNFFYNSLTANNNDYTCKVFKMEHDGNEWDNGVEAQGGDKQWMIVDKSGSIGTGNNYSFWTSSYSICYPGHFTRSTNGSASFEDCVEVDGDPYWGTLAVGPDGELYTVGSSNYSSVVVTKSTTARNPNSPVTWDFTSQVNLDGNMSGWSEVNPEGLLGQAFIGVDKSYGPGRGNVYVLASIARNSNNDPCDIMFNKSTDGGLTWGTPRRINKNLGTTTYQWFGTMSVAPNGRIDVIWLDTRNSPSNPIWSQLYYSYSLDEGETWSPDEQLSVPFNTHLGWPNQQKMGDYYHMISDDYSANLAWCNTINGEQDVYYSRITPPGSATNKTISGTITYANSANSPLNGLNVYLKNSAGTVVDTSITNATGNYQFPDVPSGNYALAVTTTKPWNSVTATDVLLYRKHIANISFLSGIYLTSGDVNVSGSLTAADVLLIRKRIANIINSFPSGNWYFNNTAIAMDTTDIIQNFNGILYGDANASFIPTQAKSTEITKKGSITIEPASAVKGEIVVPVHLAEIQNMGAFQFSIQYDANKLKLADITDWLPGITDVTVGNTTPGILTFVWAADVNGINAADNILCNIHFTSASTESSNLSFVGNPTQIEFSDYNGNLFSPKLANGSIGSASGVNEINQTGLTVYPNPNKGKFTLNFNSKKESVTIKILNSLGTIIYEEQNVAISDNLSKIIDLSNQPKGVYMLTVDDSQKTINQKIVIEK